LTIEAEPENAQDGKILETSYFPERGSELGDGNKIIDGDVPIVRDGPDIGQSPSVLAQGNSQEKQKPLTGNQALNIVRAQVSGTWVPE